MARFHREFLALLVLLAGTGIGFDQVLDNDFVNFDDPIYVTGNFHIQGGLTRDTVLWAFTEIERSDFWHPLTWLSLALDVDLYGTMEPWGFHLTNLVLHGASVLMLFAALRWMTGAAWSSLAAAALFAWHPLHVESVAWVAERKDVLSGFFWMLTMLCYLFFLARPQRDRYILLLLSFTLGLLAKSMLVTLPCALLLLDYWPLRRIGWPTLPSDGSTPIHQPVSLRRALIEKIPLFVLAGISSGITLVSMGREGVTQSLESVSWEARIGNVLVSYVQYLRKMFWPDDLAVFYPMPVQPWPSGLVAASGLILFVLSLMAVLQVRRRPFLFVGWCWYLGTLFPVIGLVKFGSFAMADRFSYIPLIGVFVMLVWLAAESQTAWGKIVGTTVMAAALAGALVVTRFQVQVWRNSITLWEHALAVTEGNFLAHADLAYALEKQGRYPEALNHFLAAVEARPESPEMRAALARFYQRRERYVESLSCWEAAVRLRPDSSRYQEELAEVRKQLEKK